MTTRETLLLQIDDAFGHQWESVQSALKNVTPEMAAWQADCYRSEPVEKDWPLPGTIAWQVVHLTGCKLEYRGILLSRPNAPEDFPFTPEKTFAGQLAALQQAHAQLRAAVAELNDAQLSEQVCRKQSVAAFVVSCAQHDIWHGAQIKMVQRLWRTSR